MQHAAFAHAAFIRRLTQTSIYVPILAYSHFEPTTRTRAPAGDYYFVKAANDLVSLGVADCNGTLTGSTPSAPSSSLPAAAGGPSTSPMAGANAANGACTSTYTKALAKAAVAISSVFAVLL